MNRRWMVALALSCAVAGSFRPGAPAAEITAKMEGDSVIRVVSQGLFETTITKRKGFVGSFWDLKNDAGKKFDLGPVLDENGILWTKCGFPSDLEKSDGSWYAAPCEKIELLESGPARVRARTSGPHCRYGKTDPQAQWKEFCFEQTFTMYPSGATYIDYCLVGERPIKLHHFLLIIKSNGSWGPSGKGQGKGEVHCASDSGDQVDYGKGSCLALQWSNGPTHFQDFLMVLQKGKFGATYWNEGYQDKDFRTGLNLLGRWPGNVVSGRERILLLFCLGQDINSPEAARRYAEDYRTPDKLAMVQGQAITDNAGDCDHDGFNEAEGCYVLSSGSSGAAFTLHGQLSPRINPAFKILQWKAEAPKTILVGDKRLAAGTDFLASLSGEILLLQILSSIRDDAKITIP